MRAFCYGLMMILIAGLYSLGLSGSSSDKTETRAYHDAMLALDTLVHHPAVRPELTGSDRHRLELERKKAQIEARMKLDQAMFSSDSRLRSPQGEQFTIEFLSSCLWSGVNDIFVDGGYAYCAFINGLMILDVSNHSDPDSVSSLPCESEVEGIFKQGNYVYLATSGSGLIIVDVSDPAQPARVGVYGNQTWMYDVVVEGTIAYVRDGSSLLLLDVSDPHHPELISSLSSGSFGRRVVVNATMAFLSNWNYYDSTYGVSIVDAAVPTQPALIGSYWTPYYVEGISVRDTLMFLACNDSGLVIVNIADPANPDFVANFATAYSPYDVVVVDTLAYVADGYGLKIINVSDPANPSLLGETYTSVFAHSLFLEDGYAYIGGNLFDGVAIVDIANPASPSLVGTSQTTSWVENAFVRDTIVFVSTGSSNLKIFNFASPATPEFLSTYAPSQCWAVYDAFVIDTLVYVATYCDLEIVDVSDPTLPEFVGSTSIYYYGEVFVQDTLAYLFDSYSSPVLQIVNVGNPSSPWVVGSWPSPGTYTHDVCVRDTMAYVAAYDSGLQIVNVADPANPFLMGAYTTGDYAYSVFVRDTLAFLGESSGLGLVILDVSDPTNPTLVGQADFYSHPLDIYVVDDLAYIADASLGLQVVDISDPTTPKLVATRNTPGYAQGVFARDSLVWVADQNSLIAFKVGYHPYAGPTWHVSTAGSDITGDGSPEEPFATIQHAIDISSDGDTVLIHEGTYSGSGNRDLDFGGRSIFVTSEFGPGVTIIDCQGTVADPHRGFYFHSGENPTAVVNGLTIRNGSSGDTGKGGGLYCVNSSPTLTYCMFVENGAHDGGGAAFETSSAELVNCRFFNNGPAGNEVVTGGGLYIWMSALRLSDCEFRGNSADHGGGVFCGMASDVLSITNCLFTKNVSRLDSGGGLAAGHSTLLIESCSFSENSAPRGSGIEFYACSASVNRSIVSYGLIGEAVYCSLPGGELNFSCSDIYANAGGDWADCIADQQAINSNFSLDPEFCDTAAASYYLTSTSPCAWTNSPCSSQIGAMGVGCGWILNDPGVPDTIIVGCPVYFPSVVHPPTVDSVGIPLYISCDEPIWGLSLGFEYTGDSVEITSWNMEGGVIPSPGVWIALSSAKPEINQFLIGAITFTMTDPIPAGRGLLGTVYMRLYGGDPLQIIDLDSAFVAPAGSWQLYADTSAAPGLQNGPLSPQYRDCGTNDIFVGHSVETSWSFANSEANMWPQSWWQQFNYCYPNSPCNLYCLLCPPSNFPNWDLFVAAIGDSQAYFPGTGAYRPSALAQWEALRGNWTGSCFGFAASGFLFEDEFLDVETEFPGYTDLSTVPVTEESRELINKYYLYQFGYQQQQLINDALNTVTPSQTLTDYQTMLSQTPRNDRVLMMFHQSSTGGHAVAPYRCIQDGSNPDLWYIYAYDNNFPQDTTNRIEVNTLTDTWSYQGQPGWGGSHGLFLLDSVSSYLGPLILTDTTAANDNIRFYFGEADSAVFISPQGTIGFDQTGTYDSVAGGSPIIPADGMETEPIGYFLPTGEWYCRACGVVDGVFTVVDGQKRIFRNGGAKSGIISAVFRPNLVTPSLTTYGSGGKSGRGIYDSSFIEVIMITPETEVEVVVQLSGLEIPPGDSVTLTVTAGQQVQFDNFGDETTYDLLIQIVGAAEDTTFYHEEIPVGSSTSHLITPDWRPNGDNVVIAIDTSMIGNFSDSSIVIPNGQLTPFICGDCDDSKRMDITDAVYLVTFIFGGGPAPSPLQVGDTDCSGRTDITDAVYLVNYIFASGPAPCALCQ